MVVFLEFTLKNDIFFVLRLIITTRFLRRHNTRLVFQEFFASELIKILPNSLSALINLYCYLGLFLYAQIVFCICYRPIYANFTYMYDDV